VAVIFGVLTQGVDLIKLRFSSLRHRWPQPILTILFRPFCFIALKTLNYLNQIFWLKWIFECY
jgi:hypothetical protein